MDSADKPGRSTKAFTGLQPVQQIVTELIIEGTEDVT